MREMDKEMHISISCTAFSSEIFKRASSQGGRLFALSGSR
jgi:hypothetical protein